VDFVKALGVRIWANIRMVSKGESAVGTFDFSRFRARRHTKNRVEISFGQSRNLPVRYFMAWPAPPVYVVWRISEIGWVVEEGGAPFNRSFDLQLTTTWLKLNASDLRKAFSSTIFVLPRSDLFVASLDRQHRSSCLHGDLLSRKEGVAR
jgi:hypothetical protein